MFAQETRTSHEKNSVERGYMHGFEVVNTLLCLCLLLFPISQLHDNDVIYNPLFLLSSLNVVYY